MAEYLDIWKSDQEVCLRSISSLAPEYYQGVFLFGCMFFGFCLFGLFVVCFGVCMLVAQLIHTIVEILVKVVP